MPYTVPNQRVVTVHRERATSDFLGIKNCNWQYAARDLGAHSLMLYLYLASNADGYNLALSPAAVRQAIGMARSTYHDQFVRLVDKGYLVPNSGNGYDFFEVPQPRHDNNQKPVTAAVLNFEECTSADKDIEPAVISIPSKDTEINNRDSETNITETNISANEEAVIIQKPKVREITIKPPTAEGRNRPKPITQVKQGEFEF